MGLEVRVLRRERRRGFGGGATSTTIFDRIEIHTSRGVYNILVNDCQNPINCLVIL